MKILVIGPSWVGDMMMSHSLYRTLKARLPDAVIDVMAPAWCRPLLQRMPEVRAALDLPLAHGELALGKRRQIGRALQPQHYTQAIVLPNSFKSALIPWFADIPTRTGWRGEMRYGLLNDRRLLDKAAFPRMVERYVALAYPAEQIKMASQLPALLRPQLRVSAEEVEQAISEFLPTQQKPILGLCPGAEFGPAKRWPHYHYAALAEQCIEQGDQVLIMGSKKDHAVGESIRARLSPYAQAQCHNLAGQTTLDQAVLLLAGCHAVVSNDSGLMHIAAALQRPLVALYGPSSPEFTPPLSENVSIVRLISGYQRVRRGDAEAGYHQSLIDIEPQQVLTELNTLREKEERIRASTTG